MPHCSARPSDSSDSPIAAATTYTLDCILICSVPFFMNSFHQRRETVLIFQPMNWIESKFAVCFAGIKLGVVKRIFSSLALSLCVESDKSNTISLISFYIDYDYNFFLESFLHDKSFNGAQNAGLFLVSTHDKKRRTCWFALT